MRFMCLSCYSAAMSGCFLPHDLFRHTAISEGINQSCDGVTGG